MEPEGWLEVSDIYMRNEQAKFLNVFNERSFGFLRSWTRSSGSRAMSAYTGNAAKAFYY
jgi:hypothetical protein